MRRAEKGQQKIQFFKDSMLYWVYSVTPRATLVASLHKDPAKRATVHQLLNMEFVTGRSEQDDDDDDDDEENNKWISGDSIKTTMTKKMNKIMTTTNKTIIAPQ